MAIHKNFSSLAKALNKTGEALVRNTERTVKRATIAAYSVLIVVTPVDTGRARAGWIVSFGSPLRSDVKAVEKGGKIPIASFENRALSTIAAWTLGRGSLYVSNSVEYIEYLEQGHSSQRPEGMLQHGVNAATKVLKKAKLIG